MLNHGKKNEYINWGDYEVKNFYTKYSPSYYTNIVFGDKWTTCGTPILAILTNLSFEAIEKTIGRRKHWDDNSAISFLKKRGFQVVEVTRNNVTNTFWENYPITPNHVLLLNIEVDKHEASWFLLHKGWLYHNLYKQKINEYFFINKPIQSAYVIYHKKWNNPKNIKNLTKNPKNKRK